jgi:hypothetical protein
MIETEEGDQATTVRPGPEIAMVTVVGPVSGTIGAGVPGKPSTRLSVHRRYDDV